MPRDGGRRKSSGIESLETRILLSESATAQLNLVSTTGTPGNPVYNYDITVHNTGTTNIGTFWFSWLPGEDFLPSRPSSIANPTGWTNTITGTNNSSDGSAIEWVANSHLIAAGASLSGFSFSTSDSPSALAADSTRYPGTPVLTTMVYSAGPFSDGGFELNVASVAQAASTAAVVSSAPTITAGGEVTFTATVSGSGATPTGSVTFKENGNSFGSMTLSGDGTAELQTSSLPTGALSITAQYSGDGNYTASTSPAINETVNPAVSTIATTTTLVSSSPSAIAGSAVIFTATVGPLSPGVSPTGTVTFTQDGNTLAAIAVDGSGTAAFTTSSLPAGADHITASYSGDTNYSTSASAPLSETVSPPANAIATTTAVASSSLTAPVGTSITFTATVSPSTAGAVPTGSVDFTQNGADLGSFPVGADGTAAVTTSALPLGLASIIASYSGDATYAVSTAAALTETITTSPTLVPTIAKSTLPMAIVADTAAHGAVTIDVSNQTGANVKGTSTVGLYASATGAIDGSAILITQVIHTLSVKTTKPAAVSLHVKLSPSMLPAGNYTLFARVIDPSSNTNDSAAGPAVSVAAAFIALTPTVLKTTLPASATGSSKAHAAVSLNIANSGNIPTQGTTTAALFATTAGVVDDTATSINSVTKPLNIKPGKTSHLNIPVKQIPALAAGTYTVVAQVTDPNGLMTSVAVGTLTITG